MNRKVPRGKYVLLGVNKEKNNFVNLDKISKLNATREISIIKIKNRMVEKIAFWSVIAEVSDE